MAEDVGKALFPKRLPLIPQFDDARVTMETKPGIDVVEVRKMHRGSVLVILTHGGV
jgi:hypothetical protein